MGGTIAVTIQTPDGQIHKMARWTNPLPGFVMHPRFVQEDPGWIETYLEHWREMQRDWEANHETGNYQFDMTPCYCPYDVCAPTGYGLVFIDMVSKVIHTHQGYTSFTNVYAYHFSEHHDTAPYFQQFAREGRLTYRRFDQKLRQWQETEEVFDGIVPRFAHDVYWKMVWQSLGSRYRYSDGISSRLQQDLERLEVIGTALRCQLENWWFRLKRDAFFNLKLDLSPYKVIDWQTYDGDEWDQLVGMRNTISQMIPLTHDDLQGWSKAFAISRDQSREQAEDDDETVLEEATAFFE